MDERALLEGISSLPPEAQKEVQDFVSFLQSKYKAPKSPKKRVKRNLVDEPFFGMWRDREDMKDSVAWVRKVRRTHWEQRRAR